MQPNANSTITRTQQHHNRHSLRSQYRHTIIASMHIIITNAQSPSSCIPTRKRTITAPQLKQINAATIATHRAPFRNVPYHTSPNLAQLQEHNYQSTNNQHITSHSNQHRITPASRIHRPLHAPSHTHHRNAITNIILADSDIQYNKRATHTSNRYITYNITIARRNTNTQRHEHAARSTP